MNPSAATGRLHPGGVPEGGPETQKFQAYTPSPAEFQAALSAEQKR